jgi:hypothetical protein
MLSDADLYYQIAINVTLTLEPQRRPVIDASGDLELFVCFDYFNSFARTVGARRADGLSTAVAAVAFGSHDHDALMEGHKASPLTGMAFLGLGARLGL